jgi:hypothetical protein
MLSLSKTALPVNCKVQSWPQSHLKEVLVLFIVCKNLNPVKDGDISLIMLDLVELCVLAKGLKVQSLPLRLNLIYISSPDVLVFVIVLEHIYLASHRLQLLFLWQTQSTLFFLVMRTHNLSSVGDAS